MLHAGAAKAVKAGLSVPCCCGMLSLIRIAMLLLWRAHYPYNRRIAEAHGRFSKEDYSDWLQNVEIYLARAIRRLAQLDQPKVYLFWKK